MNNTENNKKNLLVILGLVALIVVLVLVVQGIFMALGRAISVTGQTAAQSEVVAPDTGTGISVQGTETDLPAPSYCPNCGEKLPESFQWGQYCPYCGEKVEA